MRALGAELTMVPSEGGKTTKKLILDMIETARRMSQEPETYWTDQLKNQDSIAGYYGLGEEIWSQTEGKVDAFVHSVGTAASIRGAATVLRRHKPAIRVAAVEPGGILRPAGRPARPSQDRRDRDRLHPSALGSVGRGRDHPDQDRGREGDDEKAGTRGGIARGPLIRCQRPRRDSGGAAAGAGEAGGDAGRRFRDLSTCIPMCIGVAERGRRETGDRETGEGAEREEQPRMG